MDDTRKNIITSAQDLFLRYGIKSVSVDEICHEIGISKKTFYQFFEGKNELIEELLKHKCKTVRENALAYMNGKTAKECVEMLMNMHNKVSTKRQQPKIVRDLQKYYPTLYKEHIHNIYMDTKDILSRHLEQGKAEKIYREDLDVEMCATMFSLIQLEIMRNGYELKDVNQKRFIGFILESFFKAIKNEE